VPSFGKGWRPDTPDHRDAYKAVAIPAMLPRAVDLRSLLPPVYDQGELGSCTANAIAAAMQFNQAQQGFPLWMPSRLFIYYNERALEGTVDQDAGAEIRDGVKVVNRLGACYEALWPYDPARFAERPVEPCYEVGENHVALRYARVPQTPEHLKAVLAGQECIVFGVMLYESFESDLVAATGDVPMPGRSERPVGGHCMLAVGYEGEQVLVRNSWGENWGDRGYCRIPFAYLCDPDLADDFWSITAVA
jgi:C1A family cysteine protease